MGNIMGNKVSESKMKNMRYKLYDHKIIDSKIIQNIEHAKRNDPEFNINYVNSCSQTLLMNAVNSGREELVEYLLTDPLTNINHRSTNGNTVLHVCIQVSILKLLLDRKDLDVNIQNNWRETGLHDFCFYGHETCVRELLLDARINMSIRNKFGDTARNTALISKWHGIAKIINNSGYTILLRIPNRALLHDIVRMIIGEYV